MGTLCMDFYKILEVASITMGNLCLDFYKILEVAFITVVIKIGTKGE